ncbi:MAG TPA: hypothetical protein VKC34_11805 [Blastocatellia bacterium]|nr:hypothetical protein [Blastocatellia bacterium]
MGWPTALGIAGLFLSAAILYAGRQYALRDVCAANERFGAGAYTAVAVALASALLLAWSAVRRRNWLNIFTSSAVALACLGLAVIAFAANWAGVGGELAPDIRMRGNDGARFGFSEGFRISQIEVRGPQAMWRIRAIDQKRPPLIQEVGEIALGSVPEGYVEVEPLGVEAASLPDGDYKLTATALCAYRPAQAAFAIRQGRVVAE